MGDFLEFWSDFGAQLSVISVIDIAIIAFIIYKLLQFIRETRAEQLVKGLIILLIAMLVSDFAKLYTFNWVLKNFMSFGVIALVIVFQPELRRALEYLGRSRFLRGRARSADKARASAFAGAIAGAVRHFSAERIGALIVLERNVALNDFAETGTLLNSAISAEILENIFFEGAPLHDGAVIIAGGNVRAAACVLPLTKNKTLPSELGMRHRAGVGITEVSDGFAIIVSEETGVISTAEDGKLSRFLDARDLEKKILSIYMDETKSLREGLVHAVTSKAPAKTKDKKGFSENAAK